MKRINDKYFKRDDFDDKGEKMISELDKIHAGQVCDQKKCRCARVYTYGGRIEYDHIDDGLKIKVLDAYNQGDEELGKETMGCLIGKMHKTALPHIIELLIKINGK